MPSRPQPIYPEYDSEFNGRWKQIWGTYFREACEQAVQNTFVKAIHVLASEY